MTKIYPIATTINGNEKAFALYEIEEQSPDSRGFHRYQVILVKRGDHLAEFRTDMGSNKLWKNVRQINIPSLWEHTVDELKDIANQIRNETLQEQLDLATLLDQNGQVVKYF